MADSGIRYRNYKLIHAALPIQIDPLTHNTHSSPALASTWNHTAARYGFELALLGSSETGVRWLFPHGEDGPRSNAWV